MQNKEAVQVVTTFNATCHLSDNDFWLVVRLYPTNFYQLYNEKRTFLAAITKVSIVCNHRFIGQ